MSPRVEFRLSQIEKNIKELQARCEGIYFAFPVKCCNEPKVLRLVSEMFMGFDVSNKNEYQIIKQYDDGRLICSSGPLSYELSGVSNVLVAANSMKRWDGKSGIRINFNSDERFADSHFGIDYLKLDKNVIDRVSYVHFHNSDHRNYEKCECVLEHIYNIIKKFNNLKILNVGGHLENLTFEEGVSYIQNVREIVPPKIKVIVEVGDFLFKESGVLFCKVIDCYFDGKSQVVILDFSKMANQRWVYPILCEDSMDMGGNRESFDTVFYGCSCCEVDVFLQTSCKKYDVGEEVIFQNISPYSYQWNHQFNGIAGIEFYFV